jgi:hypothetical protein
MNRITMEGDVPADHRASGIDRYGVHRIKKVFCFRLAEIRRQRYLR